MGKHKRRSILATMGCIAVAGCSSSNGGESDNNDSENGDSSRVTGESEPRVIEPTEAPVLFEFEGEGEGLQEPFELNHKRPVLFHSEVESQTAYGITIQGAHSGAPIQGTRRDNIWRPLAMDAGTFQLDLLATNSFTIELRAIDELELDVHKPPISATGNKAAIIEPLYHEEELRFEIQHDDWIELFGVTLHPNWHGRNISYYSADSGGEQVVIDTLRRPENWLFVESGGKWELDVSVA